MKNCAFCDVASFKHQIVYAGKSWVIVYPRRPLSEGHLMLVTKRHAQDFTRLYSSEASDLFAQVKKLDKIYQKLYKATGSNLFSNKGYSAGQSIPHCHFHLVPRKESESISPFAIFNDKGKYESLPRLTPKQIQNGIKRILKYK